MNDEVHELLSALPRERASEGFTGRVVEAARMPRSRPVRRAPLAAAAAAVALLAVASGVHVVRAEQRERELREIDAQRRAIQAELQKIKRQSAAYQPVIYLGSSGEVDYVLDLRSPGEGRIDSGSNEY